MIEKGKTFKAAVINADQLLESQARGIGDSMMTETKEDRSKGWFKKTLTRIWKHNLLEGYYREKEIQKARKDILESGDLYKGEAAFMKEAETSQHHQDAMNSIITRFVSEYEEEMVHKDKGETKEKGSNEVNRDIKELIKSYVNAKGSMSDDDFKEEKKRILRGHNPEYAQEKSLYADNLLDIAKEVKDAVDHGQKLEEMDFDIDMTFGHAREGLNTETKKTALDKATQWLGEYKGLGKSLVQSGLMASSVAAFYSISNALTVKLGTRAAKAVGFAGGIAVAGTVAGFKENSRLNRERAQHMRESAKGMKFKEDDMPRREQMEQNRYETKNATEIIKDLEADLESAKAGNLLEADAQGIMARLADVEARIQKGDRQGMDLISYDHFGNVEKDRMQIDLKRAELKVALRKEMASKPMAFMSGQSFDGFLNQLTNADAMATLDKDVADKNKVFTSMKVKEIAKKVARAMLIGATFTAAFSLVADEVGAYFNPSKDGVLEGTFKENANLEHKASILEAARRWIFSDEPRMPTENMQDIPIDGTHMHLPEGVQMIKNSDGTFDIVRNGEVISNDISIPVDENGNISQDPEDLKALQDVLAKDDIYIDPYLDGGTTTIHPKDWVDKNLDNLHRIERTHLGNNTEMYGRDENGQWILHKDPITGRMTSGADLNELRTHWTNGTGFDKEGFYSMNVQHMTDDGSFQDGLSAAAHEEMKNGKLMALLSVTKDSQRFVFEVPIDKDGLFHIDPTSPEGKMLFENVNGHAVYNGAFIEIAKQTGIGKDGHELMQILGTHEGTNTPHDIIEDTTEPHIIFNIPGDTDIDPPFVFVPPVDRRIPLERGEYDNFKTNEIPGKTPENEPVGYMYNEKLKGDYSDLKKFRNSEFAIKKLEKKIKDTPELKEKYSHVLDQLAKLRKFKTLSKKDKLALNRKLNAYNKRYRSAEDPIDMDGYVALEIGRINSQIENIMLEEANVGDKPFEKSFYENSPLIKGINNSQEVVIVFPDPVGDAVLTIPMVETLQRYFKQNGINKEIKVIVKQKKILSSLENQYGGNVKFYSPKEGQDYFSQNTGVNRYVINTDRVFSDYSLFGISDAQSKDLSKVMSVDWSSWSKEEYPVKPGRINKYDTMPARISRNMELMFGQKLYEDINKVDHFIEKGPNFDTESQEIKAKYNIKDDEKIFTISAGSSVTPKEYEPEKWKKVIEGIVSKYPKAHILFLDDPDPVRKQRYGEMADSLAASGYNISRSTDGLEKMNTIMSMSDYVLTPDTGLGHYAGALGKPAVMLFLSDPVLWSTPGAIRVMHPKAYETYVKGRGTYNSAWDRNAQDKYFVEDGGVMVGMSDIDPEKILNKMESYENKGKPEAPKKPERKKARVEKISESDFKTEMQNTFTEILKEKGDQASIEKFDLSFSGSSIIGHAELKARNSAGGKPVIDLDLISSGEGLARNTTNNRIKANMLARGAVNEAVAGIPNKIKETLEKKYGQKIKKIKIKDGQLEMTFK
jgi:ADP-heptose:LPS heptosyltransferase